MQAVIRRTARVRRTAERKAIKLKELRNEAENKFRADSSRNHERKRIQNVRDMRKAAIEDWRLGPLAPMRNTGKDSMTFGAVDQVLLMPSKPQLVSTGKDVGKDPFDALELGKRHAVAKFHEGDRVVVVQGPASGCIGTVDSIPEDSHEVLLEGLSALKVYAPPSDAAEKAGMDPDSLTSALPINFDHVRLVHRMGQRDVIVDKMEVERFLNPNPNPKHDDSENIFKRYIAGTDILLDESKPPEDDDLPSQYNPHDTYALEVDKVSWEPTLDTPPFPASVLDELRNKFSKMRTRHTDDFIRNKMAIDENEDLRQKSVQLMMSSPKQDHYRQMKAAATKSIEEMTLSDDSLTLIGQYMAKRRNIHFDIPPEPPKNGLTPPKTG